MPRSDRIRLLQYFVLMTLDLVHFRLQLGNLLDDQLLEFGDFIQWVSPAGLTSLVQLKRGRRLARQVRLSF